MKTRRTLALLAIGVGLAINGHAQSFLTNGLVAYFPFNGNANDASGNGVNGTVIGATLDLDRFGDANRAYRFDGISACVQKDDIPALRMTNYLTASAWIRPLGITYAQMIVCKEGEYWLALIDGKLSCALANSTSTVFVMFVSTLQVTTSQWNHVAMSFNAGSLTLYFNGTAVTNFIADSEIGGAYPPLQFHDFRVGARQGDGGSPYQWFDGDIDDVRIYNRALSAGEVALLYEYESGPRVDLIKAVKPSFTGLYIGTNYQLQLSGDLNTWTNHGAAFTATNTSMVYPQYWDVDSWGSLFFRLNANP